MEVVYVRSSAEVPAAMQEAVRRQMHRATQLDFTHVLRNVVLTKLREWHAGYFQRDAGPSGEAWPELSPFTVQKKGHATILEETRLMVLSLIGTGGGNQYSINEVKKTSYGAELVYGTSREQAKTHQEGDPSRNIPKREFVGINQTHLKEVVAAVVADAMRQLSDQGRMRAAS